VTRSSRPSWPASAFPDVAAKPNHWTRTDQHYETLRRDMKALLTDSGIAG